MNTNIENEWNDGAGEVSSSIVALFQDKEQGDFLHSLTKSENITLQIQKGGEKEALILTQKNTSFDAWIVDCSLANNKQLLQFVSVLQTRLKRETKIYLIADVKNIEQYKQLLRNGVSDIFSPTVNKDEIIGALNRAFKLDNTYFRSKGIAFWGARGGCGVTMAASNVAHYIANVLHQPLLFTDIDSIYGDSAVLFNSDESGLMLELLQAEERLDGLLLDRAVVKISDKLHLLNDEVSIEQEHSIQTKDLMPLSRLISERYHTHIWDLPNKLPSHLFTALASAIQVCVLFVEPTLSALRDLQRKLDFISQYTHIRPLIVLNQCRQGRKNILDVELIEKTLSISVDCVIPYCATSSVNSDETGELLINGSGKIAKKLQALALNCLGEQSERDRLSWLKGVLR